MTDKELDDYIFNALIMSFDRGLDFEFNKITSKALAGYGNDNNVFSDGLKSKLTPIGLEELYKIQLLKSGYITITNDTIPLRYKLTSRGMKVQESGSLYEFLIKEKRKVRLKILKTASLYVLPWFVTIVSTGGLIFTTLKSDKPIKIQQPIKLQIEDSLDSCVNKQNNNNSTLYNTQSNKTKDTTINKINVVK